MFVCLLVVHVAFSVAFHGVLHEFASAVYCLQPCQPIAMLLPQLLFLGCLLPFALAIQCFEPQYEFSFVLALSAAFLRRSAISFATPLAAMCSNGALHVLCWLVVHVAFSVAFHGATSLLPLL